MNFRWLKRWGTPLPIPNRAVKSSSADGTAVTGGRVGRRHLFIIRLIAELGFELLGVHATDFFILKINQDSTHMSYFRRASVCALTHSASVHLGLMQLPLEALVG